MSSPPQPRAPAAGQTQQRAGSSCVEDGPLSLAPTGCLPGDSRELLLAAELAGEHGLLRLETLPGRPQHRVDEGVDPRLAHPIQVGIRLGRQARPAVSHDLLPAAEPAREPVGHLWQRPTQRQPDGRSGQPAYREADDPAGGGPRALDARMHPRAGHRLEEQRPVRRIRQRYRPVVVERPQALVERRAQLRGVPAQQVSPVRGQLVMQCRPRPLDGPLVADVLLVHPGATLVDQPCCRDPQPGQVVVEQRLDAPGEVTGSRCGHGCVPGEPVGEVRQHPRSGVHGVAPEVGAAQEASLRCPPQAVGPEDLQQVVDAAGSPEFGCLARLSARSPGSPAALGSAGSACSVARAPSKAARACTATVATGAAPAESSARRTGPRWPDASANARPGSRRNRRRRAGVSMSARQFTITTTGRPAAAIIRSARAVSSCVESVVATQAMRSLFLAASNAVSTSCSPSKAPTPGGSMSTRPSKAAAECSAQSRVARCAPAPIRRPSPPVSVS